MDWLQRARERARLKTQRTGDSPERLAELKREGGPPDEPDLAEKLSTALGPEIARRQRREKFKRPPK